MTKSILVTCGQSAMLVSEKRFAKFMILPILSTCEIQPFGKLSQIRTRQGTIFVEDYSDTLNPDLLQILLPGMSLARDHKNISYVFNVRTFLDSDPSSTEIDCLFKLSKRMVEAMNSIIHTITSGRMAIRQTVNGRITNASRRSLLQ